MLLSLSYKLLILQWLHATTFLNNFTFSMLIETQSKTHFFSIPVRVAVEFFPLTLLSVVCLEAVFLVSALGIPEDKDLLKCLLHIIANLECLAWNIAAGLMACMDYMTAEGWNTGDVVSWEHPEPCLIKSRGKICLVVVLQTGLMPNVAVLILFLT